MRLNLKKELPIMLIVALPFIYLLMIWNQLPAEVPVHWNAAGEIDRYGSKMELWIIPFLLPLLTYVIFFAIPKIDPKKQIEKMGGKFYQIKFAMTACMSVLALFIIYSSKAAEMANPSYILIGVGALFAVLGNYFKTVKQNYLLGIRTPWTLENETVWKTTHKLAGVLWFVGGILIILIALFINEELSVILMLAITAVITIVPVVYSYTEYKKIEAAA